MLTGAEIDAMVARLGPREQEITALLLKGCSNEEISRELNMAQRTVKAHFNRLFLRFGIQGGIKRVKLASMLYRRMQCPPAECTAPASLERASNG